jgi:RanBP-type and C3HC4-type zinc finger-containing protein 1
MPDSNSRPVRIPLVERIPENSSQSVPPVYSQPIIGSSVEMLSNAIAEGRVEVAKNIAAELAKKKVNLLVDVVPPGKPVDTQIHRVNVMVEDRETAGGLFVLEMSMNSTLLNLKRKVYDQFKFPVEVQRFFYNKKILKDNDRLNQIGFNPQGTLNLYLLSSKSVGIEREQVDLQQQQTMHARVQRDHPPVREPALPPAVPRQHSGGHPAAAPEFDVLHQEPMLRPQPNPRFQQEPLQQLDANVVEIHDPLIKPRIRPRNQPAVIGELAQEFTQRQQGGGQRNTAAQKSAAEPAPVGWGCVMCTYLNRPTRPGCEMCGAPRPEDYVIPPNYKLTEEEQKRLEEEQRQVAMALQVRLCC